MDRRLLFRYKEFCWTPHGAIDKKKKAQVRVKDEKLDVIRRQNLAWNYCLENDFVLLWNKVPKLYRKCFCNEEDPRNIWHPEFIVIVLMTWEEKWTN